MQNVRGARALVAALSTLLLASALSAQGFEGVIQQRVQTVMPQAVTGLVGNDQQDPAAILEAVTNALGRARAGTVMRQDVTITVKGDKMRIDGSVGAAGPGSFSILDAAKATTYTVIPAQKQIIVAAEQDVAAMQKQMQERMGLPAPSGAKPKLVGLGAGTVSGLKAEGYRLTAEDGAAVVWVNSELGTALAPFNSMQAQMAMGATPLQNAVRALGAPIASQIVMKAPMAGGGWLYNQATITSVKKQPVADALFQLPADYKQVNLSQMMGAGR